VIIMLCVAGGRGLLWCGIAAVQCSAATRHHDTACIPLTSSSSSILLSRCGTMAWTMWPTCARHAVREGKDGVWYPREQRDTAGCGVIHDHVLNICENAALCPNRECAGGISNQGPEAEHATIVRTTMRACVIVLSKHLRL
jgi:hypothetical protein